MTYKVTELLLHRLLSLFERCALCIVFEVLDLDFYLDFHAGGEFDAHKSVHNLLRGLHNVDQSLVRTHLELLAAILVLVNRTEDRNDPSRGA